MRAFPLMLAVMMTAIAMLAGASGCEMTTTSPDMDTNPTGIGPRHYVDNDDCNGLCVFSLWVYEESNGIDGLQRGDDVRDDTCGGAAGRPDTLTF